MDKFEKIINSKDATIKELVDKVNNLTKLEEVKKLKEKTKKCSLVLAAHIDVNVLGGEQAQEEVTNLFDAIENNEEDESNKISDEPIVINDEEFECNLLEETFANPSNGFACNKCDFVAKTEAGLKTHNKKKHKNNKN